MPGRAPTIVVVECPEIQAFIGAVLGRFGYSILALQTREALQLLDGPEPEIDLLITNAPQPFLRTPEDPPILYITSSPDPEIVTGSNTGLLMTLTKPFRFDDLLGCVRHLLEAEGAADR